jgi:ABC-type uncharacterized transport system permease subunit
MDSTPSLLTAGLAIFSALLYLLAVWRQVLNLETGEDRQRQQIALVGAAGLATHALAAYLPAQAGESSLGFYRVASLMFLSMGAISLIALVVRPLHTLLIVLFPLAALSILVATFAPRYQSPDEQLARRYSVPCIGLDRQLCGTRAGGASGPSGHVQVAAADGSTGAEA